MSRRGEDLRGLVHHSDRGVQYCRFATPSASPRPAPSPRSAPSATAYDNALAETVNGLYKAELIGDGVLADPSRSSLPPPTGSSSGTSRGSTRPSGTSRRPSSDAGILAPPDRRPRLPPDRAYPGLQQTQYGSTAGWGGGGSSGHPAHGRRAAAPVHGLRAAPPATAGAPVPSAHGPARDCPRPAAKPVQPPRAAGPDPGSGLLEQVPGDHDHAQAQQEQDSQTQRASLRPARGPLR